MLKSVFVVGLNNFFCLAFDDNYVKRMKIFPNGQRQKSSPGTLVSSNMRFIRIRAAVFARGGVN